MATIKQKISPCLWFDTQAEDAAKFYTAVFKSSAIKQISRYGKAGQDVHGKEPGSVMVVAFEIEGQTGLTLRWSPLDATAEEQKTFDAAHDGMRSGWGGTFDQLAEILATS